MSIFSKPVETINLDDLSELIGVQEWDRLEYKSQAYGHGEDDTREMLKDITSIANAAGGYLLLGIQEDAEGRAGDIIGIENAEEEESRMTSSCLANIEERIIGLKFYSIEMNTGRRVLICHIPRSTRAPHMITYRGLNQFWKRHGRQKQKMGIEEVREACNKTENIRMKLEDFIGERRRVAPNEISQPFIGFMLTLTPLVVKDELIDIHDNGLRSLMRAPFQRQDGWENEIIAANILPVKPTLYGVVSEARDRWRFELFRNGHM
jgi:hypothetical protein